VSDRDEELAKDSERLLGQVEDLHRLESQKRQEPISSPRFHELADAVVAKAREIMYRANRANRSESRTTATTETSTRVNGRASSGATGGRSARP
jgi:hypothetical protein